MPRFAVAPVTPARRSLHLWKPVLPVLGAGLLLLLFAFLPTWRAMANVWLVSETFGHGILVPPVSAWLIWRQRAPLLQLTPAPSWLGVACVALACAAWLAGELAGINVLAQFAVTAMVPAVVLALAGAQVTGAIAFPLIFLLFMVPAGEVLHAPLMAVTADATIMAIEASGVPVLREGLHFSLPTGRWSVVEACSGLRYLIAAAMLASVFAHLNFTDTRRRVTFMAVALAVAVVANWARAYTVVMVGHLSEMRYGVGDDHVWYGWAFFGVVMFGVFWMGANWSDPISTVPAARAGRVSADTHRARAVSSRRDPRFAEERSTRGRRQTGDGSSSVAPAMAAMVAMVAMVALISVTQFWLQRLRDTPPRTDVAFRAADLLRDIDASQLVLLPRYEGAQTTLKGHVRDEAGTEVFVAYFGEQHARAEMIGFGNAVVHESDPTWQILSREVRQVQLDNTVVSVREWRVRSSKGRRLVWSWYTVGGKHAEREFSAKLLTAWSMMLGRGDHSTVSVVSTTIAAAHTDASEAASERASLDEARARLAQVTRPLRVFSESVTGP